MLDFLTRHLPSGKSESQPEISAADGNGSAANEPDGRDDVSAYRASVEDDHSHRSGHSTAPCVSQGVLVRYLQRASISFWLRLKLSPRLLSEVTRRPPGRHAGRYEPNQCALEFTLTLPIGALGRLTAAVITLP